MSDHLLCIVLAALIAAAIYGLDIILRLPGAF